MSNGTVRQSCIFSPRWVEMVVALHDPPELTVRSAVLVWLPAFPDARSAVLALSAVLLAPVGVCAPADAVVALLPVALLAVDGVDPPAPPAHDKSTNTPLYVCVFISAGAPLLAVMVLLSLLVCWV